jgi:SIR2-like domain
MDWKVEDWERLARYIRRGQCTPFIGAGASSPPLPTGRQLASHLAERYRYPCSDPENLVKVAQWALAQGEELDLKGTVCEFISQAITPESDPVSATHEFLVDLELPVYITTNYDDLLATAFERRRRPARKEIFPFYQARQRKRNLGDDEGSKPTPQSPLIYHLHGVLADPLSMVLTEDDYLDFLIYIHPEEKLLPSYVQEAFSRSVLLFVGYSLNDMDFKVLFRRLASSLLRGGGESHFAVQLDPKAAAGREHEAAAQELEYLEAQYRQQRIKVFWGSCADFVAELDTYLHGRSA